MKRQTKYYLLVLTLLLFACGEQSPVELIYDNTEVNDDVEIEIISPNPDEVVYTTGYDSTGIVQPIPNHLSNVYVSGIKNSANNETFYIDYYSALFFDETQPIMHPRGRRLGFKTRMLGKLFFNNIEANLVPHIIHIKEPGQIRDENAGFKYVRHNRGMRNDFPFNSNIRVKIEPMRGMGNGRTIEFEIPTPNEITGKVTQRGRLADGDLKIILDWNNAGDGNIEIVIGGIVPGDRPDPFPLLRLRTKDDGELTIPNSVINSIPFQNFEEIVFSFIRQKEKNDLSFSELNDPNIIAQSIHNIKVVIQ